MTETYFDYIVIGSGFGGSVSALRLSEKGYKVLVIEKGKEFRDTDFPKNNWQLKKWLWEPNLWLHGFFKMTFLNHVTVLSGVGVGGGSLTYANTLHYPKEKFFNSGSWAGLKDWQNVLRPYYNKAKEMLGATENTTLFDADRTMMKVAEKQGKKTAFKKAPVGVYFGEAGKTTKDPYFDGDGPDRTGCIFCGACMTGCRYNAKNTLDKNYLYLARKKGAQIWAEKEVVDVVPAEENTAGRYTVYFKSSIGKKQLGAVKCNGIVFAGGVIGTVPLLLKLKKRSLPRLSDKIGCQVRTNNEALISVTSLAKKSKDYSKGLAIGSVLHLDSNTSVEPVRYGKGSGFARMLALPMNTHQNFFIRILVLIGQFFRNPSKILKAIFTGNYAERTSILLFMQTVEGTLRLKLGKLTKRRTVRESGPAPKALLDEAYKIGKLYGELVSGIPFANFTDVLTGTPTTAHILGGAVMGATAEEGAIDTQNRLYGYPNMYVCDGSMISSNPGVNPALSITAISEYAMSNIPIKKE